MRKPKSRFTAKINLLHNLKNNGIRPFREKPSDQLSTTPTDSKDKLQASDLFSLFTADIIKEEVVFTR